MPRYVAFLRAINVGGRNVPMSTLKQEFERLGFGNVGTFIASGNVMFTSESRSPKVLARKIEAQLHDALGYEVLTFVRTWTDVASVAKYRPFSEGALRQARSFNVGFLEAPLSPAARSALLALTTEIDTFHASGREIYWMCRKGQSESKISNAVLERALKVRSTFRGMNTIVRLAAALDGRKGPAK